MVELAHVVLLGCAEGALVIEQDTFSHWSHHRGQMTVYLRLLERKVPGIFGPSADEKSFS